MPAKAYQLLVIVLMVACFGSGCEGDSSNHRQPPDEARVEPKQTNETMIPHGKKVEPLQIFAEDSFYLKRKEPEEVLIGILQTAPVREGPNTRDMPYKLVIGDKAFNVYTAGFDEKALRPFVGHEVVVVGKRIDQSKEGYGTEIWIATISRR